MWKFNRCEFFKVIDINSRDFLRETSGWSMPCGNEGKRMRCWCDVKWNLGNNAT